MPFPYQLPPLLKLYKQTESLRPLICLFGHPGSGKTTVAEHLESIFNSPRIVDDGEPLRRFVADRLGIPYSVTLSARGKADTYLWNGESLSLRTILGRLGNALEREFGDDFIPWHNACRINRLLMDYRAPVLPSVRKAQCAAYQAMGYNVVGVLVDRPFVEPSGNDFDLWDEQSIDYVFDNSGAFHEIAPRVHDLFAPILGEE